MKKQFVLNILVGIAGILSIIGFLFNIYFVINNKTGVFDIKTIIWNLVASLLWARIIIGNKYK